MDYTNYVVMNLLCITKCWVAGLTQYVTIMAGIAIGKLPYTLLMNKTVNFIIC